MKKLRGNIDKFYDRLDENWRSMPIGKQRQYIRYLFVGYLLLTLGMIAKVWYDTRKSNNDMEIKHIENPIFRKSESPVKLQDTLSKN